jgi:CRISPR/Cas system-associated endoribonuclease Cas2
MDYELCYSLFNVQLTNRLIMDIMHRIGGVIKNDLKSFHFLKFKALTIFLAVVWKIKK